MNRKTYLATNYVKYFKDLSQFFLRGQATGFNLTDSNQEGDLIFHSQCFFQPYVP